MDAVEEIKSRLSVEDVVGEYIELKRAGRNFRGLSPFSGEKTPSLMVSPEKQIWHDFSSGKGGNIFGFVMEIDGVDFKTALEILARKAGVDLDSYRTGDSGFKKKKNQILDSLELATKYYQQSFLKNQTALNYVTKNRKFNKKTIGDFRLGYSPNTGKALVDFLKKRQISPQIMQQASLMVTNYRGDSDMFRGRIMIPLADAQGQTIGFTARLLDDDPKAPKYINTSSTVVYDKSRHVFGLHLAKDAIRKAGFVVIVEGNLDVISSHQVGVNNVVATAGTALTASQLKILQRFTTDIRLCFDQDKAGITAAERSIAVGQGVGVQLSIITIDGAKDPDELIQKDPDLWRSIIKDNVDAVDWLISKYQKQFDLTTASGKKQFTDVLLATINKLEDSVEQDHYLLKLADLIGVSENAIRDKQAHNVSNIKSTLKNPKKNIEKIMKPSDVYQDNLLSLPVAFPITRSLMLTRADNLVFSKPEQQRVYEYLEQNQHAVFAPDIPEDLKDVEDYVKILLLIADKEYPKSGFDNNDRLRELGDLISKLKKDNQKLKQEQLHDKIKLAEESNDEVLKNKLLNEFNDLVKRG